jgi:hypothetical protein
VRLVRSALTAGAAVALAAVPVVLLAPTSAGAATVEFTTVGTSTWTVPAGVSCISFDVFGANGGNYTIPAAVDAASGDNGAQAGVSAQDSAGGTGGEARGEVPVVPGQTLQINVGGRGGDSVRLQTTGGTGGFNGGAAGGSPTQQANIHAPGAGGGGASDIRQNGTGLANRIVVAGGGGGAGGFNNPIGGAGGGESGDPGGNDGGAATAGGGGTQSTGGAGGASAGAAVSGADGTAGAGGAGAGGALVNGGGGGGGGGWFGGGGGGGVVSGAGSSAGGGGGSGFILGETGDLNTGVDADNSGNGKVAITYEVGDTSCLLAPLAIKKTTSGAVAKAGDTFTVSLQCTKSTIDTRPFESGASQSQRTFTFTADASGTVQPAAGYVVGFTDPNSCTVTETATSRTATASYACTGTGAQTPLDDIAARGAGWRGGLGAATAANPNDPCQTSGPQATPLTVDIVSPGQTAAVTVTNALVEPAAAAIVVTPRFTG